MHCTSGQMSCVLLAIRSRHIYTIFTRVHDDIIVNDDVIIVNDDVIIRSCI